MNVVASAFSCACAGSRPKWCSCQLRLARDGLEDVRVDLGERMVARDAAERVRQRGVAAAVVEGMARLVQERLVVVQPALRAGDEMHDLRRVARDHARAGRLLRAILEVEPDVRLRLEVEAERGQRREADVRRAVLRVGRLERRQPAHERRVVARGDVLPLLAQQPLEPPLAQPLVGGPRGDARRFERGRQLPQGDALLVLVALDRARDSGVLRRQRLPGLRELEPVGVEARARRGLDPAQLLAVGVDGQDRKLRLCGAKRQLLALERNAVGEEPVLELVLPLRELGGDEAALAGLAQAEEQLPLVARRGLLRLVERLELLAAEQVGVAADDLGLLRDLLLPHAHRPAFLGALEEVAPQLRLEVGRRERRGRAHAAPPSGSGLMPQP